MNARNHSGPLPETRKLGVFLWAALVLGTGAAGVAFAGLPWKGWWGQAKEDAHACAPLEDWGGQWYWLGSPEQQKRITMNQYNRYCIRCHGVDGRGVWDVPDVPDFTNARWQACRSDGQLVANILEGRGACMPAFRGTLTLEEAWSMARYLRSFLPGTETSRPELGDGSKDGQKVEPMKKPS
jgi:mono/diheme cytochrome c family protein